MIRKETSEGWILITHGEHARLAGLFAEAWGNADFAPPLPQGPAVEAVYSHDDGWAARDASPFITRTGVPEAFTKELVGAYSAFEEIDFPNYVKVREAATAAVAKRNPHAAIIVSMHTVNLLTEQADLSTLKSEYRPLHAAFIAEQIAFQEATAAKYEIPKQQLQRAFKFLQCCDNLSLIACSDYPNPRPLRHAHPDRLGNNRIFECLPQGGGAYVIQPFPFRDREMSFDIQYREIKGRTFTDLIAYREAVAAAPYQTRTIKISAG